MIPDEYLRQLPQLLKQLEKKMPGSGEFPNTGGSNAALPEEALRDLVDRLSRHYPFHQPFYAGQMLKPPHPAAWLAYALAMTINPNNHALDGGPEASFMEKEVIRRLMHLVGFTEQGLGHLTSSGTIANLEALWVARELHPDRPFAVSSQAHYTHQRMAQVLRHPVMVLPEDEDGLPDPSRLSSAEPLPGTVVVTLGTTGTGRVEPLHRILPWARKNGVRIHVDAAYGGFFHLLRGSGLLDPGPWEALSGVDSIVIDPHKHGLQPYGCGAVLFRDPAVGKLYRHDSPYTYFTSDELHLGEISLECSRAGAAAVALWFTLKLLLPEPVASGQSSSSGQPSLSGQPSAGERSNPGPDHAATASTPAHTEVPSRPTHAEAPSRPTHAEVPSRPTHTGALSRPTHTGALSNYEEGENAGLPRILADCRNAALRLYDELKQSDRFQPVMKPELDIVTYVPVTGETTFSSVSRVSEEILKRGMDAGPDTDKLYLSTLALSREEAARWLPGLTADADRVRVLRSVLMKPEHLDAVPDVMRRLNQLHRKIVSA